MNLITKGNNFHYEIENLIRIFYPDVKVYTDEEELCPENVCIVTKNENTIGVFFKIGSKAQKREAVFSVDEKSFGEDDNSFFERKAALLLFDILCEFTSYKPLWGILTGVRPAKLMTKLCALVGEEKAREYFINELRVSESKTNLAFRVSKREKEIIDESRPDSFSLYVAVPFCPSRCSYCSFVSHSNEKAKKLIPEYIKKLCEEIAETGKIAKELSLRLESIYIGGGTPTVLSAEELSLVTKTIENNFDFSCLREYTIEAGRPDSITEEKLQVIKDSGCTRISINPQTFSDDVLKVIGRNHSSLESENAFRLAREMGFDNINMDLIAGLPTDTLESFKETIRKTLSLSPENVTIHTLALKRSSNIVTEKLERNTGHTASSMLEYAEKEMVNAGFEPYYMYRQSKCLGNLENVGWSKEGYNCLYNVYMMEECHTVLSAGAGAVTKLKAPNSFEIQRIFNYKYPYEYINDFGEILKRKKQIKDFYSENPVNI